MTGWVSGLMCCTGLAWGKRRLLRSDLGCERVKTRRWHQPLLSVLQQDPTERSATALGWFPDEVLPSIRKQVAKATPHIP